MIDKHIHIQYNWPDGAGETVTVNEIKLNPVQIKKLASLLCEFGMLDEKYASKGHLNIGANIDGDWISGVANYTIIVKRR